MEIKEQSTSNKEMNESLSLKGSDQETAYKIKGEFTPRKQSTGNFAQLLRYSQVASDIITFYDLAPS